MNDRSPAVSEECLEPELVSPGGQGAFYERPDRENGPAGKPGLLTRVKTAVAAALALLGMGLFLAGAVLTSTIIGAIVGIPLMLAGALVFFLLFKLLTFGSKNAFVFRRF